MNMHRLLLMRTAARVERCHTVTTTHRQTVGEHTFGVLAILLTIYPKASASLMRAAIFHDVAEAITGDIPSPIMVEYPTLREVVNDMEDDIEVQFDMSDRVHLDTGERKILRYCDRMDLLMFSIEELDTGNKRMGRVAYRVLHSLANDRLTDVTPEALTLYDYVRVYWEQHYQGTEDVRHFHDTPDNSLDAN